MSTFYVRKDGSGTHTTIQSAIMAAVDNDIIDIGEGLFEESLDVYKGIKLYGAGKDKTFIQGSYKANLPKSGTWTLASKTINIPAGTAGLEVGRIVTGSGLTANSRIVSVDATSITVDLNTTAAKATLSGFNMIYQNDACVRVRGGTVSAFAEFKDLKVIGNNGIAPENPATEYAAIYFRNTGLGTNYCQYAVMDDCHIEANGEYALLADYGAAVGNITIKNCLISGKTFVGSNPSSGNQFSVANVPRQLVTFQSVNLPITFINNIVEGTTGGLTTLGVASFNTAVTIDAPNSTITGNTIKGTHGYGYALRVRGAGTTASSNVNYSLSSNPNSGYLIGPTGAQTSGMNIGTNSSITRLLVEVSQSASNTLIESMMEKSALKAISKISSDAVFSDEANWKLVNYVFKHASSSRRLVSSFRNFDSSKKTKLKTNMKAGDRFELQKIIISKSDRSHLVVKRSELSGASSFDFDLLADGPSGSTPPVAPSAFFTRDFSSPNSVQPNERLLFGAVYGAGKINFVGIGGEGGWYVDDTVNSLVTIGVSYKVRMFFTGFLGETGYEQGQLAFAGTSQVISRTQLAASLGSYLDITVVADSNADSLLVSLNQRYYENSLSLTKIEIFEL